MEKERRENHIGIVRLHVFYLWLFGTTHFRYQMLKSHLLRLFYITIDYLLSKKHLKNPLFLLGEMESDFLFSFKSMDMSHFLL